MSEEAHNVAAMDARTLLAVRLSAAMGRNQYTTTPEPVIVELQGLAGPYADVLAREAGMWVGYHRSPETEPLCAALLELPGAAWWVPLGVERRGWQNHRINPSDVPTKGVV